jgi:nucleoside-diphosphate-sugar epimerase
VSQVLITGGVGTIGSAVVRRLLRDSAYEVRVSDQREAPASIREARDVRTGDLRSAGGADAAVNGSLTPFTSPRSLAASRNFTSFHSLCLR